MVEENSPTNLAERKISKARTSLVMDKPFLGALVLRMPLEPVSESWCPTTATDARTLYYNPEFFAQLSDAQCQFALAHEVLHCALLHFNRRGHRDRQRWDVACDYAINTILLEEDLEPVPGALIENAFKGMSAEEIYPCIENFEDEEPHDNHLYGDSQTDSSDNTHQPQAPGQQELEELASQWQQKFAGAAQLARQAGKISGGLARLLTHQQNLQMPWRNLLARYVTFSAKEDYSFSRPSTRREGEFISPSLRSATINLAVAIDISGSIKADELADFIAEINALHGQVNARVTLMACDVKLAAGLPRVYEAWEHLSLPDSLQGGGGTAFGPVFDWLNEQDTQPDLLVYFTDGLARFPKNEPAYPVFWLIKGSANVPWGQRIQLN